MDPPYQYTPYIWPMLVSAAFSATLVIYVWHRRSVPSAPPLALGMFFTLPWSVGAALELAAVDAPTKIFWSNFQGVWQCPATTAVLCFALEYANLGRWLTRRTVALLTIIPILVCLLILTNDAHHLMVLGYSVEEYVRPVRGSWNWVLTGYGYFLSLASILVLAWLFIRSPLHRAPVALILGGMLVTRVAYVLEAVGVNLFAPMDPTILALTLTFAMYTLALFRFRLFDPIPVARAIVIDQMREAMLVLDPRRRIVDLNRAAEKILGVPTRHARGHDLGQVLPACSDLAVRLDDAEMAQSEIGIGADNAARNYALHLSPLKDQRGLPLGYLILLHDVTEQKRMQAQLLEQQRVAATLGERERLARELHDGLGQVLGYVKMRAQTARDLLAQDQIAAVDACLENLVAVAQDAHADIREYLLSTGTGISPARTFLAALREYLQQFSEHYGIRTELSVPPELADEAFDAMVQVQLLRIIQEALTNVRKHARARGVSVSFAREDNQALVVIQDDGVGFEPVLLFTAEREKFGLRFMHERAEEVGGSVQVQSTPGQGTQVIVHMPTKAAQEERR